MDPRTTTAAERTDTPNTVSIVVPNLNGATWLRGCLRSLAESSLPPLEVIVADDGSTDESADVAQQYGARFEPGGSTPSGFARTANRGLRVARGRWILLLNNDTQVPSETIGRLVHVASETGAEIVAPLILSMRKPGIVDSAGLLLFRDGTARPRLHCQSEDLAPNRARGILLPSGTAMLLRRDLLDTIGYFDESFGSYAEDLDWGLRAARAGIRTVLAPDATILHWFSGTAGALSPYKAQSIERNHVIVAVRHLPWYDVLLLPFWTATRWLALATLALRNRSEDGASAGALAGASLRGALEGAASVPSALRERRKLARELPVDARTWRRRLAADRCRLVDFRHFGA